MSGNGLEPLKGEPIRNQAYGMLKKIDMIRFLMENFQMAVIAMITLKSCNLMLGRPMRKYLKNTR